MYNKLFSICMHENNIPVQFQLAPQICHSEQRLDPEQTPTPWSLYP